MILGPDTFGNTGDHEFCWGVVPDGTLRLDLFDMLKSFRFIRPLIENQCAIFKKDRRVHKTMGAFVIQIITFYDIRHHPTSRES